MRPAARAVVLDPADRVLLVRFEFPNGGLWATPGGGVEPGETHEEALARELVEELGLVGIEPGRPIWIREHVFPLGRWDGQVERYYLVRVPPFEPRPALSWAQLNAEYVTAIRWWTLDELDASAERFAPRQLGGLLRALVVDGAPEEPIEVGI